MCESGPWPICLKLKWLSFASFAGDRESGTFQWASYGSDAPYLTYGATRIVVMGCSTLCFCRFAEGVTWNGLARLLFCYLTVEAFEIAARVLASMCSDSGAGLMWHLAISR